MAARRRGVVKDSELRQHEDHASGAYKDGPVAGPGGSELGEELVRSSQRIADDEGLRVFLLGVRGGGGGIGPEI